MADQTKQLADQSFFVFVRDTVTGKIRRTAIPGDVQIGLQGNPAELQLLGRLSLNATDYSITAANQGNLFITNDDTIISVTLKDTPTSGRIRINLPANPRNGQLHFIKDMSGTANLVPLDVIPSGGSSIDQFSSKTLTDAYGSFAVYWFGDRWRILVAGVGVANIGAAAIDATYVVLSNNTNLSAERRLNVSGTNLTMTDNGANSSVTLNLSSILGAGAGTFAFATVTADSFGRITAISAGTPAPVAGSYLTVTAEPGLTAERAITAGNNISFTDGGANSTFTVNVDLSSNYGTYAGRGTARQGRYYYSTNSPVATWVGDGSVWRPVICDTLGDEPPTAATFTSVNPGTGGLTQLNGSLQIDGQSDATANSRGYFATNSATTAYAEAVFTMIPAGTSAAGAFTEAGLSFRESGTGKQFTFLIVVDHNNHTMFLQTGIWANSTSRSSTNTYAMPTDNNGALWIRLRRTSTQCFAEVSRDRIYWSTFETQTITTVFTTAPDQLGVVTVGLNIAPTAIINSYKSSS